MSHPILVTGAAGGTQGSTGRLVASLLLERGIPVRALVHKLDSRSDGLRKQGAEVVEGDLLNPASVEAAMRNVKRAYFTYPVADGLLEAVAIFAGAARDAGLELVVNNSQFQGTPDDPAFRYLKHAPSFRNLQHRLADRIFDWAQVGAVHLQAPPYYENVRALVSRSVAEQNTVFLPWGENTTVIPLVGAEDVSHVAAGLLGNPGAPSQSVYPLVSETPTVKEMIDALGRAIGRPIRYVAITDEQWANAVKERINPHALDHLSHLWQYFRRGEERFHSTDSIRAVTGRDPLTLEDFFKTNAEAIGVSDLDSYGVAFVSLRDNLDLSTASGRLMFQIIGAMAEFERSLIQERVRAGLRNAKLKGKTLGRPPLTLDRDRIARLRASGASIREISAQLEVSTATVHKALRRR